MSKEELKIEESGQKEVKIKLGMEEAVIVKSVEGRTQVVPDRTPDGQPTYIRNDIISLQNLLSKFDTRSHPKREWSPWARVKEKLYRCYAEQKDVLVLSLQEAVFLREFLDSLPDNEAKNTSLREGEVRTMEAILDQLYTVSLKKA